MAENALREERGRIFRSYHRSATVPKELPPRWLNGWHG